jgi:hypothetical protein
MRVLAALLLVLSPVAVLAEDDSSPPRWSLGAGISTTYVYLLGSGAPGFVGVGSSPSGHASLERRLSDSSWLVLGLDGTISDREQDAAGGGEKSRQEYRRLALDLGVRRVVTRPGAVVDFSLLAVAMGGYQEQLRTGSTLPDQEDSSWYVGGNVGFAVDRELTEGLSVRIATPVAGVTWQKIRTKVSDEILNGHELTAGVFLAPRLELRLAF